MAAPCSEGRGESGVGEESAVMGALGGREVLADEP
jgi:hypothetical protein